MIKSLATGGLMSMHVVGDFLKRRIAPLQTRARLSCWFSGSNELGRIHRGPGTDLSWEELELLVKGVIGESFVPETLIPPEGIPPLYNDQGLRAAILDWLPTLDESGVAVHQTGGWDPHRGIQILGVPAGGSQPTDAGPRVPPRPSAPQTRAKGLQAVLPPRVKRQRTAGEVEEVGSQAQGAQRRVSPPPAPPSDPPPPPPPSGSSLLPQGQQRQEQQQQQQGQRASRFQGRWKVQGPKASSPSAPKVAPTDGSDSQQQVSARSGVGDLPLPATAEAAPSGPQVSSATAKAAPSGPQVPARGPEVVAPSTATTDPTTAMLSNTPSATARDAGGASSSIPPPTPEEPEVILRWQLWSGAEPEAAPTLLPRVLSRAHQALRETEAAILQEWEVLETEHQRLGDWHTQLEERIKAASRQFASEQSELEREREDYKEDLQKVFDRERERDEQTAAVASLQKLQRELDDRSSNIALTEENLKAKDASLEEQATDLAWQEKDLAFREEMWERRDMLLADHELEAEEKEKELEEKEHTLEERVRRFQATQAA
eukprot:XP_008665819.1 MAP7 domain-containing protein 1-like [Zea mays]